MFGAPKTLDQLSGMPHVGAAFSGWTLPITLITIKDNIVDGLSVEEVRRECTFQGVIQPLSPRQLELKPEGERSWQWYMIHCISTTLNIDTNDKIEYKDNVYKVMKVNDYSLNGYIEYHVVLDFQNE